VARPLFGAIYLLSHGISKVILVALVLRNKLWAYPWLMVLLGVFIGYQLYVMIFVKWSWGLRIDAHGWRHERGRARQIGLASTMPVEAGRGMAERGANPGALSTARNSCAVRSRPPRTITCRSSHLAGCGSLPGSMTLRSDSP
jgi:hypothetical protein